jgi:two-component system, cell cycle response regulator DivK
MPEKTILIVEDNDVNRKLLLTVLRPYGYRLLVALDGEEAVQIASQEIPDLILMDLQLPRVNGYTATQRIKAQAATACIPIIALTAHAMAQQQEHAFQVGFDGYITKPINTRTFPGEIRQFLAKE